MRKRITEHTVLFVSIVKRVVLATIAGAVVGLSSVLAGAANTPIAASIMAVELFGPQLAPYATVACVISFLMTGHRRVYPSQILSMKKSAALQVTLGKNLDEVGRGLLRPSLRDTLNHLIPPECIGRFQNTLHNRLGARYYPASTWAFACGLRTRLTFQEGFNRNAAFCSQLDG